MELQDQLIGALIGIARATENTLPEQETYDALKEGLAALEQPTQELVARMRDTKFALVPDCRTCMNPCGHNDDYDMTLWHSAARQVQDLKARILAALRDMAQKLTPERKDLLRRGLFMLGYTDDLQELQALAEELENR